jgi:hypothetical protein
MDSGFRRNDEAGSLPISNPEPRTPNPEPRIPNPESRIPACMSTDYKNTINLPKTDFAMKADEILRARRPGESRDPFSLPGKGQDGFRLSPE